MPLRHIVKLIFIAGIVISPIHPSFAGASHTHNQEVMIVVPVDPQDATNNSDTTPYKSITTRTVELDLNDPNKEKLIKQGTLTRAALFFVILDDNGAHGKAFGCNDSLVSVPILVSGTQPLKSTLEQLLTARARDYNKTYTSVFERVSLRIDSLVESSDSVRLSLVGPSGLGGVCDTPRLEEQLFHTIRSVIPNATIEFTLNGKRWESATSFKGTHHAD